jgi:hypothetical protein
MDGQVRTHKEFNQSKGHSLPEEHRQMDKLEQKESDQIRDTHSLESADGWTSQNIGRIRPSKGHSLAREYRQTNKSGHKRNLSEQRVLTNWRAQIDS